jgi:UDP-N-acetylmuramoyl-tripeptide--D-alanyl-D-alanine ligase
MIAPLDLREIATALQADYSGVALPITGVSTDTRTLAVGDLYVALRGDRFDGHQFIDAAIAAGAVAVVVDHPVQISSPGCVQQLVVRDTREAYGLIARCNRRHFGGPVVGITGSAGKTTCKEMIAAILARAGDTLATQGNLNNEVGVPRTLLQIGASHRFAVIEMGAARAGDIEYLCRFAEPDVGVVTAIMPAHLEGFGSIETIANTKGEMFAGLAANGVAIINADEPYVSLWRQLAGNRRVVTFGLDDGANAVGPDVSARAIQHSLEGTRFELNAPQGRIDIVLGLLGRHNLRNALAAAAATLTVGASLAAVRDGLAELKPVAGRLQPRRGLTGNTVIDDSYNANPGAVKAAIDVLASYTGRRLLVLATMAELGPDSELLHRDVARHARLRGIEALWLVGPWAQAMASEFGSDSRVFADNADLIAHIRYTDTADAILVKGSRSTRMETVVAALCGDAANAAGDH